MKLRIAQVGSLYENTPPPLYGGTERIVSSLTEGLVAKGHDVTLFATEKAITKARLVSACPEPLARLGIGKSDIIYPLLNFTNVFKREKDFDIIHFHLSIVSDYMSLPPASLIAHKTVFTIHFVSPSAKKYPQRMELLEKHNNLNYISISHAAQLGFGKLKFLDTVYNGINLSEFTFNSTPKDYYVWMGKFNPDKGTLEAILAAKKANIKLILAGTIDLEDEVKRKYYENDIRPLIDGKQIIYVGEKGGKEKDELLGNALGFLNPILWNEPFGLVSIEAMATGTPVISFSRGALTETVKDCYTGYLVENVDEMAEKIKQISAIRRTDCRKWVEDKFSSEIMVTNYENVYQKILNKP